jgi:sec-independent protein translocase protein TatA
MEIAVIAVIALIVLGPARLPEMARSLGNGMRELRGAFSGEGGDSSSRKLNDADDDEDDDLADEDDELADDDPEPIDLDAGDRHDDDEDLEFRPSSSDVDAKPAASA